MSGLWAARGSSGQLWGHRTAPAHTPVFAVVPHRTHRYHTQSCVAAHINMCVARPSLTNSLHVLQLANAFLLPSLPLAISSVEMQRIQVGGPLSVCACAVLAAVWVGLGLGGGSRSWQFVTLGPS